MKATRILSGIVILMILVCCTNSKKERASDFGEERLHLTTNALWDDPKLSEEQSDYMDTIILKSADSAIYMDVLRFNDDKMSREEAIKIYPTMEGKTRTPFGGYIRLFMLNDIMVTISDDSVKAGYLKSCLEEGYRIAKGKDPVPLSMFLMFWSNTMVLYSNIKCSDSVYVESQRLLKICKSQDIPQGLLSTYEALGHCLMDANDYVTAAQQFAIAEDITKQYFPMLLGKDWEKDSLTLSDLGTSYVNTVSLHLKCCVSSKDTTWIQQNLRMLTHLSKLTDDFTSKGNLLTGLASYYDMTGNDAMYEKTIKLSDQLMQKHNVQQMIYKDGSAYNIYSMHLKTKVNHFLRKHDTEKAFEAMQLMPKFFFSENVENAATLYAMQGKYKEATRFYQKMDSINNSILNGRNRNTLASLSTRIDRENKEMQMVKMQLEQERTKRTYEGLLLGAAALLIVLLVFFYYRQHRQSQRLAKAYETANEAYEVAKKANEVRDIFLKNMNHEVHTPLNHIYGFAQLMADRSMPVDEDSTREMADAICHGAEQLTKILDNMVEVTDKLSQMDKLEDVDSVVKNL